LSVADGIALSASGDLAYVTDDNCAAFPCTSDGFVTVLSTRTYTVLGTVSVGINPQFTTMFSRR
jgi:DNA-binding beta-propeller fold protein YncE